MTQPSSNSKGSADDHFATGDPDGQGTAALATGSARIVPTAIARDLLSMRGHGQGVTGALAIARFTGFVATSAWRAYRPRR